MLVKYKTVAAAVAAPGLSTGYTLLFDESAGDANEKFAPSFRDVLLKPGGYGAASAPKIPLANTEGQIPFRWSQSYATAAAAAAAIATLRSTFKGIPMHLQVTVGATVLYFPNSHCTASSHDQKGTEMIHQMTFETDDLTTTAP